MKDCRRVSKRLVSLMSAPDLLICSHAARAVQTSEALAKAFALDNETLVVDPCLYMASATVVMQTVSLHAEHHRHVMVVGHNPGFTHVYNALSPNPLENLPSFGVAHMQIELDDWSSLAEAEAEILELVFPKRL